MKFQQQYDFYYFEEKVTTNFSENAEMPFLADFAYFWAKQNFPQNYFLTSLL